MQDSKQSVRQSQILKYNKQLQQRIYLNEKLVRIAHSVQNSPIREDNILQLKPQLIPTEKDIEAKNFIKSLKQQSKERQEKAQQMNQSVIEKRRLEYEELMKRDLERVQLTKMNREQQIEEAMNKIKQRKEERERQLNEWMSMQKQNKGQEPLYVKYQREFEEKVLLPKINNEKAVLSHISATMKPLSKEEFHDHELRYKERQKMMELELQKKRQDAQSPFAEKNSKFYQSQHYQLLKELSDQGKKESDDKIEKLKKFRQKQETYDKFVKECHPAKASPTKHNELLSKINQLKHPVRSRKHSYDNYLLEFQRAQQLETVDSGSLPDKSTSVGTSIKNSGLTLNIIKNQPTKLPKKIDYLQELKSQRQAQSALNSPTSNKNNKFLTSQRDLVTQLKRKNLTQEQKYEMVKLKSQAIEAKARYQESGYNHQALDLQSEVNKLYLDSIKTKMALLDEL